MPFHYSSKPDDIIHVSIMPGTVILQATKGPLKGNEYKFEEHDTFVFGRAHNCHARLSQDDITASRHHFILEVNPPDARLRDLGSMNGTYVNDRKYGGRIKGESPEQAAGRNFPAVDLKDNDIISVGETVFAVRTEIPDSCRECGCEIPTEARDACRWGDHWYVCTNCRESMQTTGEAAGETQPARCKHCGKDVTGEAGAGRPGEYVCRQCRESGGIDPIRMVKNLFRQLIRSPDEKALHSIEDYEMDRMLGRGGMGAVYLARRKTDGKQVAVKVMLAKVAVDERSRQRFHREIEVTRSLRHQNIVELLDHGSAGSGFFFAMEFCPGGSVEDLMANRGGRTSLKEAGAIILEVLEGLAYAHNQGYVHRDIKPQNILLGEPGGCTAKLSDFGLAKSFEKAGFSGMTATGITAGTPLFMPREQLVNFKYSNPVSDVWSVSATFYYMLTGKSPREYPSGRDPIEIILRSGFIPIRKRDPNIPSGVAEVIDRALDDDPNARYPTAKEFHHALSAVL